MYKQQQYEEWMIDWMHYHSLLLVLLLLLLLGEEGWLSAEEGCILSILERDKTSKFSLTLHWGPHRCSIWKESSVKGRVDHPNRHSINLMDLWWIAKLIIYSNLTTELDRHICIYVYRWLIDMIDRYIERKIDIIDS